MTWWSAHTHSKYSANDALPSVQDMVARAVDLGYPALGLTDHRTVAGSVKLYKACRKAGIEPLPGCEFNVAWDYGYKDRVPTFHLGVLAISEVGYRNLCRLSTISHRRYRYLSMLDLVEIADLGAKGDLSGLVVMTGCYFGLATQTLLGEGKYFGARALIRVLGMAFDQAYVEIQNHDVPDNDETDTAEKLVQIASELGLPVVVTQDSHYLLPDHQPMHDAYKELITWGDNPDDAKFPGTAYAMVDLNWIRSHHEPRHVRLGLEGLDDLYQRAKVRIPELESYSLRVPDLGIWREDSLHQLCQEELTKQFPGMWRYKHRLEEELEVIDSSGFASYLLLVREVCEQMRTQDIWYSARGSVSGSLVCYLLHIHDIDPLAWKLRFDRFLSRDRTKPPDIDLDVEHARREEIVQWLSERFPISHIATWLTYSLNENTDKYTGEVTHKGSLRVKYYVAKRKKGEVIESWEDVPWLDKATLTELSTLGLISGYGVHAAGFVIAKDQKDLQDLPLAYVSSSKTFVTQYDKDDVEALGYVKLDMLGLKTLEAMHITANACNVRPQDIPFGDREVYRRIRNGNTTGIFQLEGWSSQRGIKALRPRTIHHIIAAMALFRPAAIQSGATDTYLARHKKHQAPPVMHADIMDECHDTYGVLLYQEQVIGVLRRLGMAVEDLNAMLKAVKASNAAVGDAAEVISSYSPVIEKLAQDRGWNMVDVGWLMDAIDAFASYSFNKAHATAYGIVAYRCAWYLTHHPTEFWAAMLSVYGETKPEYLPQARRDGVRIMHPNINISTLSYRPDPEHHQVWQGLLGISGIGEKAANELVNHAPYVSLEDLGQRVNHKIVTGSKYLAVGKFDEGMNIGVIGALTQAKAIDGIPDRIEALSDTHPGEQEQPIKLADGHGQTSDAGDAALEGTPRQRKSRRPRTRRQVDSTGTDSQAQQAD